MISKLLPLLFVLVRLAFISSEDEYQIYKPDPLKLREANFQEIQNENFEKMNVYTKASWDETAPEGQNYHIFPLVLQMRTYAVPLSIFHAMGLSGFYSSDGNDNFLGRPYELARILDQMQNTSEVELKFPNAFFYDPSSRRNLLEFLDDMGRRFQTEVYEIPFLPQNEQSIIEMINDWTYRVTNGRQPKESYKDLMYYKKYRANFLSFTGSWESTKTRINTSALSRNKRFIPMMSDKTKTLRFEGIKERIEVDWFSGRETIGYYEDVGKKFKAISIPFKNTDFAMIVMLPNYNQSLEIFRDFTDADYRQVLQRVNETYQHVDYTIPVIDSQTILINSNGASINGKELRDDAKFLKERSTKNLDRKLFIVDRPFGIMLHHKPTSLVFMQALVRNPSSRLWPIIKYHVRSDS